MKRNGGWGGSIRSGVRRVDMFRQHINCTQRLKQENRGPNPAAANYTLQSTLMDMQLGNRHTQLLMAGMDKYPILLDRRQQTLIQKYETESPGN